MRTPFQNRRKRSASADDGSEWTAAKQQRAIEQIAKMTKADWDDLVVRLAKFAAWRLWVIFHSVSAPAGTGADHFVSDAVCKVLQGIYDTEAVSPSPSSRPRGSSPRGARRWDPDRYTLFNTLCTVVWSDTINHAKKLKRQDHEHQEFQHEHKRSGPEQLLDWRPGVPLPPDVRLQKDAERQELIAAFEQHSLAQQIAMVMIEENTTKPAEIAEILGESPKKIYKKVQWVKSKLKEMLKKKVE